AVYFSFDSNGDVVPGMPAEVYLIGTDKAETLAVPVGAVSEQQGENFVYVKVDDHAYKKQPVTLGRSDGRRIEVLSGVNDGDSVVTYGSTFVRLAETSTVVPEGHSHSH
ncbi:efflux RND transporter periplasmic adaptor subunit, partial [Duncaniella muris]